MADANYLARPTSLAAQGSPIVVNNACGSWHSLAARFVFAGARGYVGTLFPVTTSEAHDVIVSLLEKQWGKVLPHALWSAQNSVYGDGTRRPYIVTGVWCTKLRVTTEGVPSFLATKFVEGKRTSNLHKERCEKEGNDYAARKWKEAEEYYSREAAAVLKKYMS